MCASRLALGLAIALAATSATSASSDLEAVSAAELGFVYVEGNVGGASGGHAALRVGETVHHLALARDGVLRFEREPWGEFLADYGTLQNRPVHVASLRLGRDDRLALERGLTERHLEQRRLLDALAAARRDRELVEAWLGLRPGLRSPGSGLFDPRRRGDPYAAALRVRVEAELGGDFLVRERARVETALATSDADWTRHREQLALADAAEGVARAHGLADGAWVEPPGAPLSAGEARALASYRDELVRVVVALLRSRRPDRGRALGLAAARFQALSRSLERGRPIFLDPYPDDAPALDARAVAARRIELRALGGRLADLLAHERERLARGEPLGERGYQRLEEIAGRATEVARGLEEARPIRQLRGRLVPARGRVLPVRVRPLPPGALERARRFERELESRIEVRHGYDLLRRNCVTELVRALNETLGERVEAALGGRLEPGEALSFVPFVFFEQVRRRFRVERVERFAPHRQRALAALRRADPRPLVVLREANTLTSTLYGWRDRDGAFLFFTDDVVWPRPLYGALNLAYGLLDGALGVATVPFDRGRRLVRGARGVLFSLPELVFLNVRKGSFDAASLERWSRPVSSGLR